VLSLEVESIAGAFHFSNRDHLALLFFFFGELGEFYAVA
jgi:hypothetical protein